MTVAEGFQALAANPIVLFIIIPVMIMATMFAFRSGSPGIAVCLAAAGAVLVKFSGAV